jgi:hypothetical protein
MSEEKYIRSELVFHLTQGHAHMPFTEAVANFPQEHFNTKFTNGDYTFWHLIEHIRRTQADILNFIVNPDYQEPEWPKGYWPAKDEQATKRDWDKTVQQFLDDQTQLKALLENPKTDLYKKIPKGTGQTLFREVWVIVDHNAYHIGEFAIMRQVHGTWDKNHK